METYKQTLPNTKFQKGCYTIEITREEWESNGITEPGYYKYNKRAEGLPGILCRVWLNRKEIDRINAFFALK